MSKDTAALIAEARKTQGYSEGDLRSLVRDLADALRVAQAKIADALAVAEKLGTGDDYVGAVPDIRRILAHADVPDTKGKRTKGINLFRDLGYDESSPEVIEARRKAEQEGDNRG